MAMEKRVWRERKKMFKKGEERRGARQGRERFNREREGERKGREWSKREAGRRV